MPTEGQQAAMAQQDQPQAGEAPIRAVRLPTQLTDLELLIPYATLEPVRELLLQMFMGEKFGRDSIWENHLASELWMTDVHLSAVLDQVSLPLRDVLNWKVGTQLPLNTRPDGLVDLRCGDVPMFRGRMGRLQGNIAVRIDRDFPKPQEAPR